MKMGFINSGVYEEVGWQRGCEACQLLYNISAASPVKGSSGALSATPAPGDGAWEALSWGDGVIIGLVVACLTVIYVVGMTVFIQYKRKKKREKIM